MIGRGLVLTASHCLFSYGESPKYSGGSSVLPYKVFFVPSANKRTTTITLAGTGATGPYGSWEVDGYSFPTCYVRGNCTGGWTSNDIALIRLKKKSGSKPLPFQNGIGYFGYGWNNYGFVSNKLFSNIKSNQIGYASRIPPRPHGDDELRTTVYPSNMAPIGLKLCQNAFQTIP